MVDSHQIVCPHCSAVNRVPAGRAADVANCGVCKQLLFLAAPPDVDQVMFKRHVTRNSIPVLVDVWARWCGPCRVMATAFAQAAGVLEPGMRLVKLNAQNEPEAARVSGAMDTPAIIAWACQQAAGYDGESHGAEPAREEDGA